MLYRFRVPNKSLRKDVLTVKFSTSVRDATLVYVDSSMRSPKDFLHLFIVSRLFSSEWCVLRLLVVVFSLQTRLLTRGVLSWRD